MPQEEKPCSGEEGNGFELWRRLCADHKGQRSDTIKQAGATALHTFPKCEKVEHLGDHLDAWEDPTEEFGQELSNAPGQLLVMFKKTLPTSINNELTDWPLVGTCDYVLAFCRRRTDYRKERDLCEFAKKKILTKTRLSAMTSEQAAQMSSNETQRRGSLLVPINAKIGWQL